jgi:hypothetical protein
MSLTIEPTPSWSAVPAWAIAHASKLDRHLLLAIANDFADHIGTPNGPFKLMLRIRSTADQPVINRLFAGSATSSLVSAHFDAGSVFVTASVDLQLLAQLAASDEIVAIELGQPLGAERTVDRRETASATTGTAALPQSSGEVLMGIIDHGCPFAHQAFREASGAAKTRFISIWDQDQMPDFPTALGSPLGFGYGRQVIKSDLDGYMAATLQNGSVNETLCYLKAQYSAMRDSLTHGSHTAGLFAGAWRSPSFKAALGDQHKPLADDAAKSELVFVQLPRQVLQAPSHGGDHQCILDGIRYVVACAGAAVKKIVVVVDYGSYLGPHDGSSFIESAMAALVTEQASKHIALVLVFPTGNGYADKTHATANLSIDKSQIAWRVPAGSETASFAEIWLPENAKDLKISLTLPNDGLGTKLLSIDSEGVAGWPAGPKSGAWFNAIRMNVGSSGTVILLRTGPTQALTGVSPQAASGRYLLSVEHSLLSEPPELTASFYCCWGGENLGFPRRSFPARWLALSSNVTVGGAGSMLGTACGGDVLAIAGVIYADGKPFNRAKYSGAGPSRGPHTNPDMAAISDDSLLQIGVLGIGTRSGAWARMWGTSVATPIAARKMASVIPSRSPFVATKVPTVAADVGAGVSD